MNVKIKLLYLVLLFAPLLTLQAQEKRYDIYAVGFYNLENLFDTIHQQGKNDYEFLPDGVNKWSTKKYSNKIKNIAKVLDDMASDVPSSGLAAVGVCEVENAAVLRDLVSCEPLVRRGWSFALRQGLFQPIERIGENDLTHLTEMDYNICRIGCFTEDILNGECAP